MFFKMALIGSNLYVYCSPDKINWVQIASPTITSVFTTAPNAIGFAAFGYNVVPQFYAYHFEWGS
jgi:hypothetical protein